MCSVGGSGSGDGSPSYKRGSIVDAVGGEEGEPKEAAADSEDGDETAARSEAPPPVAATVEQPPAEPGTAVPRFMVLRFRAFLCIY